ncbi:DUF998 domain-containing protein [Streptomyces sp. NPDC059118]|uniref:DUF998 domain-containing protein n=1 Tax=unclassified Streptomyces TaxID=2593676 RepID=UPI00367D8B22
MGSCFFPAGPLRSKQPVGAAAPVALAVGCAGPTLRAPFRTDRVDRTPMASRLIHRYATGAVLAALPAVGLLLARRPSARPDGRDIKRLAVPVWTAPPYWPWSPSSSARDPS